MALSRSNNLQAPNFRICSSSQCGHQHILASWVGGLDIYGDFVEYSRGCGPELQQRAWPILCDFDSSRHFSNRRGLRPQPGVACGAGHRVDAAITDQHCWDLHEMDDYITRCLGLCLVSDKR